MTRRENEDEQVARIYIPIEMERAACLVVDPEIERTTNMQAGQIGLTDQQKKQLAAAVEAVIKDNASVTREDVIAHVTAVLEQLLPNPSQLAATAHRFGVSARELGLLREAALENGTRVTCETLANFAQLRSRREEGRKVSR